MEMGMDRGEDKPVQVTMDTLPWTAAVLPSGGTDTPRRGHLPPSESHPLVGKEDGCKAECGEDSRDGLCSPPSPYRSGQSPPVRPIPSPF